MGRNLLSKWWSIFSELIGARDSNVDKTRRSSFGKCSLVMKHETLRSLESSKLQNCYSIHCCVFHSAFQGDWESKPLLCASTTKRPRWRWFDFTSDRNFRQCSRHEGGLLSSIEQGILPHANFIFFLYTYSNLYETLNPKFEADANVALRLACSISHTFTTAKLRHKLWWVFFLIDFLIKGLSVREMIYLYFF